MQCKSYGGGKGCSAKVRKEVKGAVQELGSWARGAVKELGRGQGFKNKNKQSRNKIK